MRRLLPAFRSWTSLVLGLAMLSLVSNANAQTTTIFRGHTLGESWQTFIRTEGGLCHVSEANAEACQQAAAGEKAVLSQQSKENHASTHFSFEAGRLVSATGFMEGPKFAELTFLEKTYGKPSFKTSEPEKVDAVSVWNFPDGGTVLATETRNDSGGATIKVSAKATSKKPVAGPNAEDVCSFIVGKIRQAVPDVPTMCHVGETSSNLRYDITVFSTVDVLRGKLRRAWSTALFDSTQDLFYGTALDGACHALGKCSVSFSDADMAKSWFGRRYRVRSNPSTGEYLHGDLSSDQWYRRWWDGAMIDETFEHGGSQGQAESIGKEACEMYAHASRQDRVLFDMPTPTCSVLVATDSVVCILMDFPASATPILNYSDPLPETFGKAFSGLPYEGIVTFKTAWKDYGHGPTRDMMLYDLRDLEFLYDEVHSGLRDAAEVDAEGVHEGQTDKYTRTKGAGRGRVVSVTPRSDGRSLIKLTEGSEWSVLQTCQPYVGDDLLLRSLDGSLDRLTFENYTHNVPCNSEVEFVGSW